MTDTRFISVEKTTVMNMGLDFVVHKDVVDAVLLFLLTLGCRPVSNRLISIRLRAAPFNITFKQVYAATSGYGDSEVDHFYQQLQAVWLYKGIGILSWEGCTGRLGRGFWALLQCQDK